MSIAEPSQPLPVSLNPSIGGPFQTFQVLSRGYPEPLAPSSLPRTVGSLAEEKAAESLTMAVRRALQLERARIARDLHDHVGSELTYLALLGEAMNEASDSPEKLASLSQNLVKTLRNLARQMDEVVWLTDPSKDTLASFAAFLSSYAETFVGAAKMRLRLNFPVFVPATFFPSTSRHELLMVAKEALNNAAKHARASEIRITLRFSDTELFLIIEDNGSGFPIGRSRREGSGLRNMRDRLGAWGGIVAVQSVPGKGTKIRARMPLPSDG